MMDGRSWLVLVATAALVVAAGESDGAYFSQSWGWVALAFLAAVVFALTLASPMKPGRLRVAFAALMGAVGVWIALSALWSFSPGASLREAERMLVYVSLALLVALVLRVSDVRPLADGLFAGVSVLAVHALATRLLPDIVESARDPLYENRLSEPLGYANSLGLLLTMGTLLGLGWLARDRTTLEQAAAAAVLPILSAALYFTFSRGAFVALGLGMVVTFVLDPRRLWYLAGLLTAAPGCALAVALCAREEGLTKEDATVAEAASVGHRVAVWLLVVSLVSAALAAAVELAARSAAARGWRARYAVAALIGLAGVVLATVTIWAGGPAAFADEIESRIEALTANRDPDDLNDRLLSLSGTGRDEILEVIGETAWDKPVHGHGAGTFEYHWYELRRTTRVLRDAHSLYAEMLVEVGVVGLTLLALALAFPLVAAPRARHVSPAAAAAGAYAAWVAHSAIDWHWEMVTVPVVALLAGGAVLAASEHDSEPRWLTARTWGPLLAVSVALSVAALVSLVGNQALFAAREAVQDDPVEAIRHADRARRLLFWSAEPEVVLGDAAARLGDREGALAAYRSAVAEDPQSWTAWLRRAQVARGGERRAAYARVRALNPLERELPGAPDPDGDG